MKHKDLQIYLQIKNQNLCFFGYLYKFFKNIYIVNICLKDNLENSIPLILKLKQNQTFLISKYIRIARMFGEKKLSYILKELNEIDEMYKNGDENANYRLKNLIVLI